MKQKDLSVVASRDIILLPWDVYSPSEDDKLPDSNYSRMKLIEGAGFPTYEGFLVDDTNLIIKVLDHILDVNSKSDIRADGVVLKVDSHKLRKQLGVASKFTNWMTCFKPQSASGTTYLRNVTWQMGRTGKLSPVATCDAVILAGASVTRASLNNETWIATMGLTIGAKVEMLRSGDVIPQIVKVLDDTGDPIIPPTLCPECKSTLVVYVEPKSDITTRWCENAECPGRVRDLFTFIGSREILEIDGLADDMSTRLVTQGYARNVGELFAFQTEALEALNTLSAKYGEAGEDKFAMAMAKKGFNVTILKMLRSMEKAKTGNWDKWIAALGIPFVGRTLGKVLAKQLALTPDDMANLPAKLEAAAGMNIENMGDVKGDILRKWSLDPVNRAICQTLFDSGVRPTSLVAQVAAGVGQPLVGVSFIITGEFDEDRESLTKKLESLGAVSKSSVSKNCTHFIVGEGAGKSKLMKYDELVAKGCKIEKVGKDWLTKTLASAGMGMKDSKFAVEEV
jgi:DNA ligase (NAD+)